ncbi:tyrosine-type recombinase/integrase [Aliamphritea hakodatensis]|uniref:tyrosine-type recombinase/integrase n=1 Tax=Aliamphritea hakodatensis TaxID=2895352 RepID=UPI0022FDAC50|nr:tyrosine-type recombinase/integrase [Aliamphritea hakodatensis]
MSPRRNDKAPHLKVVNKPNGRRYFYYRMPNGDLEPLKTDSEQEAIEAANALTTALRASGTLVEKVLNLADNPQPYNPRNPPMMQVIDEYMNNMLAVKLEQGKISQQTFDGKQLVVNEYNTLLGKTPCQQVTTFDLAQHLKSRSGHVQNKHIPLLKELFRYAIAEGYRDNNPATELQPKVAEPRQRKRHTLEGFQKVRTFAPEWIQRTMDIALYSLQRRSDLIAMHRDHVNRANKSIKILQQKTRNYSNPVYIQISMGDALWNAVDSSLSSNIPCPYLVHCRPVRMSAKVRDAKPHPFAVLPDYLSKQFSKARDASGAYDHLPKRERPTLHDIRALGILMYFKAGYSLEYIMALAGHGKVTTTEHYIAGHEQIRPVAVNADLSLDQVNVDEIDWNNTLLPPEIARLVDEGE